MILLSFYLTILSTIQMAELKRLATDEQIQNIDVRKKSRGN
jgi:hypothetical protein